jgi:hypothetical protein
VRRVVGPTRAKPRANWRFTDGDDRIRSKIGRGGLGVVYEAEPVAPGRRAAWKVLAGRAVGDGQALRGHGLEQVIYQRPRLRAPDRKPVANGHAGSGSPVRPTRDVPGAAAGASGPRTRELGRGAGSLPSGRLGT